MAVFEQPLNPPNGLHAMLCGTCPTIKAQEGQHPGNRWAQSKTKRGITRTPLRFGKLVGRSTAKRSVIRGQWKQHDRTRIIGGIGRR